MATDRLALTVHQPWASLIMAGVKTIETRPAPPNGSCRPAGVRGLPGARLEPGDRLAIHAAATRPVEVADWLPRRLHGDWCVQRPTTQPGDLFASHRTVWTPLGVVLGTVRFDGAVPIIEGCSDLQAHICWTGLLHCPLDAPWPGQPEHDVSNQLPLGDFTPGRWAWLLADPHPIDPVPAKGAQGVWRWTDGD